MKTLCPFFKERCHGNECVMWKNEECLIASFLKGNSEAPEEIMPSSEETIERSESGLILHRDQTKIPKWLKASTPEELAIEILEYKKKEFPEDEKVKFHTLSSFFWDSKGVDSLFTPSEVRLKMERANFLAEREITRQEEAQRKQRLQEEKEELPSLVSKCFDWAITQGLKRLTLSDVDTFIMEKDLDVLSETKRALYAMANVKLKSRK